MKTAFGAFKFLRFTKSISNDQFWATFDSKSVLEDPAVLVDATSIRKPAEFNAVSCVTLVGSCKEQRLL